MNDNQKMQKIVDYISTQALSTIATVNEQGRPEAALIGITETENLELIFGTENTTRKYQNLQHNPHVAFVIGQDFNERITIQYEGVAQEVEGEEAERCKQLHIKKNPRASKFANKPEQRWFKVKPTWIRYLNLKDKPPTDFEVSFSS